MKNIYQVICLLICCLWLILIPNLLSGQSADNPPDEAASNALREEVQRYFGYEDLIYRYLTLPYDISANVNQQGKHVDIGFVLLALMPLVLLSLVYHRKKIFYAFVAILLIYILLCFRFSFLLDKNGTRYNPAAGQNIFAPENARWDGSVVEPLYKLSYVMLNPVKGIIDPMTGQSDHITYPVMVILFMVLLFVFLAKTELTHRKKTILLIGGIFVFLWWLLSGGIIWYGFLIIPLALAGIISRFRKKSKMRKLPVSSGFQYLSIGVLGLWVFLAYSLRISNISIANFAMIPDKSNLGKMIVEPRLQPYSVGMVNANECIDLLAKNLVQALDQLNGDSETIYQVGSSLNFEIRENHKRMFEDNTLGFFYQLANQVQQPSQITQAFKEYGFKYIILDLMLPTLDRTPEKSLTSKYTAFVNWVREDDQIDLIATDRLVKQQDGDGTLRDSYALSGERLVIPGSYAVFVIR